MSSPNESIKYTDTERETRLHIAEMANESFSEHILTKHDSYWRCQKPGTNIYSFNIAKLPGLIVVWGDLGTLTLDSAGDLEWLINSINSHDYIVSKSSIEHEIKKTYYSDEFRQHIEDEGTDDQKALAAELDYNEEALKDYVYKTGDYEMASSCYGHGGRVWWCYEALKCFVRLYKAQTDQSVQVA